ncbi:hypothetical protein Tco_0335908 [Tanacetum coccineum]
MFVKGEPLTHPSIMTLVAKFTAIGFDCLFALDEKICPRFIYEFYKTLRLERDSTNHFSIQFTINNHHFNISLAQFTELTYLPNQGICIYSDAWGLDELEKTLEQIEAYNSRLFAIDDVRNLIHRRIVHEKNLKANMAQDPFDERYKLVLNRAPPSDNGDLPSTKLSPRSFSMTLKDDYP